MKHNGKITIEEKQLTHNS